MELEFDTDFIRYIDYIFHNGFFCCLSHLEWIAGKKNCRSFMLSFHAPSFCLPYLKDAWLCFKWQKGSQRVGFFMFNDIGPVLDGGSWLRAELWETTTLLGWWCLRLPVPTPPYPPAQLTSPLLAVPPYSIFLELASVLKNATDLMPSLFWLSLAPYSQVLWVLM